jgi:hypothetical protein
VRGWQKTPLRSLNKTHPQQTKKLWSKIFGQISMWTLKSAWDQYVIDKSGYREENIVAIETNWKDYGIKGKKT